MPERTNMSCSSEGGGRIYLTSGTSQLIVISKGVVILSF